MRDEVERLRALIRMRDECFAQVAESSRSRWRRDRERLEAMRGSRAYRESFRLDEPLVSVIIPTYNRAELILERALPSVLRQDYSNWELLIIGDAMDESQARRLRTIADPRVKFVNLKSRGNYPERQAPRWFCAGTKPANVGLRLARGQWIAHLDDDDELLSNHLGSLLGAAREQQLEWVHGKVLFADEGSGATRIIGARSPRRGHISRISSLYHGGLKNFRYHIDVWRYFCPGDWDLWFRFLEMGVRHAHVPSLVGIHYGADDEIVRRFGGAAHRSSPAQDADRECAAALYRDIESLLESGNAAAVEERLSQVLRLDPDHALAHNDLGTLLLLRGEYEPASAHLQRAYELAPDDWVTVNNLARFHQAADNLPAAQELVRAYVANHPLDRQASDALQSLFVADGECGAAQKPLQVRREPGQVDQRPRLGVAAEGFGPERALMLRAFTAHMLEGAEADDFVNACLARCSEQGLAPRVSIVIPVFNKVQYTQACLESIARHSGDAIPFEVIIVDNASSDGTLEYLHSVGGDLLVWRNEENLGFARATNQGAMLARGEYLVFLNNDTEVQAGWLQALIAELDDHPDTGAAGARLLYPDGSIQHAGVAIGRDLIPYHLYRRLPAGHPAVTQRRTFPVVTAACMAVRRTEFYALGLLDEGFVNGHEDVDLCLRYRQLGKNVVYRPDCVAVHHESVSDGRLDQRDQNVKRIFRKWRYDLVQDDFAYRFASTDRPQADPALAFAIKIGVPDRSLRHWGDIYYAECLAKALVRVGHSCRIDYLNEWGNDDLDIDVVIHLKGLSEYFPKPWNVNILWMLNHPSLHTREELERYDAVCVASRSHAEHLRGQLDVPVHTLEQATDPEHFRPIPGVEKEFDLIFVGNNNGTGRLDMRQIVADLLPTRHRLAVWGDGWEGLLPDGVWKGKFVPWERLPEVYARARIVLNDHQPEMREYGFVNNRTFDALACGAAVVSDDVKGLRNQLGLHTYRSRQELHRQIDEILSAGADADSGVRREKILNSFTFERRVEEIGQLLVGLDPARERAGKARMSVVPQLLAHGPRVSVLMSTYNRRDLLPAAIESIRGQTYRNWELIVINDGGEDVSDLIAAAGDHRVRLIDLPRRCGKPTAINTGFRASDGAYVAYLDDDDIWYPDHLQRLMLAMVGIPGVRMAYSDAYNVTQQPAGDGYEETDRELVYHHQVTVGDLVAQNRIQGITVAHERALFERVGGMDPGLRVLIDWDMWRRLAACVYPYHVSRITADHFLREEASTEGRGHITHLYRLNPVRYAQMRRRILRKELALDPQGPLPLALLHSRRDAESELLRHVGQRYEQRGMAERALRFYELAIQRRGDNAEALRQLGRLHLDHGRAEQALSCFWKCAQLNPTIEDFLAGAAAYLAMGRAEQAAAWLAQLETQKSCMSPEMRERVELHQYRAWLEKHAEDRGGAELAARAQSAAAHGPRFHAIVCAGPTQTGALADSLEAFDRQLYPGWHLSVLAPFSAPGEGFDDDGQLRWLQTPSTAGAAAGIAQLVAAAGQDWIAVLRPGVRPHPELFFAAAEFLEDHPECRLVYTDHDFIGSDGERCDPQFKPDLNLELLRSQPYVGLACLVRADAATAVGGLLGEGPEAMYDLMLRVADGFGEHAVGHITEVLFHLPRSADTNQSTEDVQQIRQALAAHLQRRGLAAEIAPGLRPGTHFVTYQHPGRPKVSIIIPTRDRLDLLRPCVLSLLQKTSYSNFEVLIVDNQSSDPATLEFMTQVVAADPRVRVLQYGEAYSYAAVNNFAVAHAGGDYLLLLNNDTVIIQPEWLDRMLSQGQRADVGIVGARLLFPKGRIQHAGVILGMGENGVADHVFLNAAADEPGQLGRAQVAQEMSAVTAACLLVRRDVFAQVGGLDEKLAILYNDVDLCLKVREHGLRVIWTPFAMVVHHGSSSLKQIISDERMAQYGEEAGRMLQRWLPKLARDPAYSPALSLVRLSAPLDVETDARWRGKEERPRVLGFGFGSDGSWRHRVCAPLRALSQAGVARTSLMPKYRDRVRIPSVAELERMNPSALLLHNTVHETQLQAMENYKRYSRALMVFSQDDLMIEIPDANPFSASVYRDMRERLERGIGLCDRLVVTTEPLAHAYRRFCEDIRIIPNSLDSAVWSRLESRRRRGAKPRVGWAGAQQHAGDLMLIFDLVRETAHEIDWVFFGLCFEELLPYVAEVQNPVAFEEYPSKLASLDLDLAVAPLEINRFNEAKSNLKLLEYGALGIPVVCSDIVPYQGAPVGRVRNTKQAWRAAILDRIHDLDAAAAEGDRLRDWVRADWMLDARLEHWLSCFSPAGYTQSDYVGGKA